LHIAPAVPVAPSRANIADGRGKSKKKHKKRIQNTGDSGASHPLGRDRIQNGGDQGIRKSGSGYQVVRESGKLAISDLRFLVRSAKSAKSAVMTGPGAARGQKSFDREGRDMVK